eukprot:m.5845 g.5845  ORF g.5845 m.5845 type:complete len:62 (-) comp7990_c0_seq1:159-344(-)
MEKKRRQFFIDSGTSALAGLAVTVVSIYARNGFELSSLEFMAMLSSLFWTMLIGMGVSKMA